MQETLNVSKYTSHFILFLFVYNNHEHIFTKRR